MTVAVTLCASHVKSVVKQLLIDVTSVNRSVVSYELITNQSVLVTNLAA